MQKDLVIHLPIWMPVEFQLLITFTSRKATHTNARFGISPSGNQQKGCSVCTEDPFRELQNILTEDEIIILNSAMGKASHPRPVSSKECPI